MKNRNVNLEVLDLRFNSLADLVDSSRDTAYSIEVNQTMNEIDTLNFTIGCNNKKLKYLNNESLIKYENQIYKVFNVNDSRDKGITTTIECDHIASNLAKLNFGQSEIPNDTPEKLINAILANTGWLYIGTDIKDMTRHLVTENDCNVFNALVQVAENFEAVLEFGYREEDNKFTVFLRKNRLDRGLTFEYSFNLLSANANRTSNELYTRLTMFGANDEVTDEPINIASINNGKTYIEDYTFFIDQGYTLEEIKARPDLFLKELIETDDSIDDVNELKKTMEKRLEAISQPRIEAEFTIADLSEYDMNLLDMKPQKNERVWVYDPELKLELEATITNIGTNSDNPVGIDISVSNVITYSTRFGDIFNNSNIIGGIVDSQGKINGIYIKEATIDTLHCKDAFITSAKIDKAAIQSAHIAAGAVGSIAIENGAVGNMHISDLNADKIKAGTISTANVKVASAEGEIEITGYQVLVNDTSNLANKVNRVILGKYKNNQADATEEFKYGLVIRGTDGKTIMIDENGVHNAGITDGSIDDNKVSDDANISGGKINISSLIHEINKGEGSESISGMVINIDNKSLEVIYKESVRILNEHTNSINSQNTEITQNKEDIRLLYESVSQIQSGELVGTTITSTNGNIFNGENKETSLVLKAFSGTKEITDTITDDRVKWYRNSGNPALDNAWNNPVKTGKIINLAADDILNRSTFSAQLLSKPNETTGEVGVISISQITLLDYNDTIVSSVAPTDPSLNLLWIDTSVTPNLMKRWNGTAWEIINDTSDLEEGLGNVSNEIYAPNTGLLSQMEWAKNEIKVNKEGIALKADKTEINSLYNKKYKVKYIREYVQGNTVNSDSHWVEFKAFSKGLNILQNTTPQVISGANPRNLAYITDGIHNDKTKFATISGNTCIQFTLPEVREDIEFLHIWHYYMDDRKYNNNKIQISEDGVNWITIQDNTENPYKESEQGNIIPVGLGSVIGDYGSRIQSAELKVTPEAISSTVRNSMADEFSSTPNLLDRSAKFESKYWTTSGFVFNVEEQNASMNLRNASIGEISTTLETPIKLDVNSYYCFSFHLSQKLELFNHKVDVEMTLMGDYINKTYRMNDISIDSVKQAKVLYYQHLTNDSKQIIKQVKIKIYRKNSVTTDTFIKIECPQIEKGAFPSKWTYPYDLLQKDEYSYREQTKKSITDKVSNGDFESYKTQTATEISQKISTSQANNMVNSAINDYKTVVEAEFVQVDSNINELKDLSDTIFKDNIVDIAEKETLIKNKKILEKEHSDVIGQIVALETCKELVNTTEKTNLTKKKVELETAFTKIIEEIDKVTTTRSGERGTFSTSGNDFKIYIQDCEIPYTASHKLRSVRIKLGGKWADVDFNDSHIIVNNNLFQNGLNTISLISVALVGDIMGAQEMRDIRVTKSNDVLPDPDILPTSISLNKTSIVKNIGDYETLVATVLPSNSTNKTVTWSSSNSYVASVVNGRVECKSIGNAIITVQTHNGRSTTCNVTVRDNSPSEILPNSISLNKTSMTKKVNETENLTATILPSNATNKTITWTSSNTSVATVTNGVVTARAKGTTTITARTHNSLTATCRVNVEEETVNPPVPDDVLPTSISLNKRSLTKKVGETETLLATILPSNSTNKNIIWSSSNTTIASVSTNGTITCKKVGSCEIKAKTHNNIEAICSISVIENSSGNDSQLDIALNNYSTKLRELRELIQICLEKISQIKVNTVGDALTEFKQTTEDFQFKVVKAGHNNLLKNSAGMDGLSHWEKHIYGTDTGMNIIDVDYLSSTSSWAYKSTIANTFQIRDKNSHSMPGGEMALQQKLQTEIGQKYTLQFIMAGHRVKQAYLTIRGIKDDVTLWNEHWEFKTIPSGGEDTNNWMVVEKQFTAKNTTTTFEVGMNITDNDPYLWFTQPIIVKGEMCMGYTTNDKELIAGITTIDEQGVKVSMSDGEGEQGYSRTSYDGLGIYDKNNSRKAWFGQGDSAYIQKLTCDIIENKQLVKMTTTSCPSDLYVSSVATGDGTGRNSSNKSNSITGTVKWLKETHGCYLEKNITINVDAGTYYEDVWIEGLLGKNWLQIKIHGSSTWHGWFYFYNNIPRIYLYGRDDYNTWSNWGCKCFNTQNTMFEVRGSHVEITGFRCMRQGYSSTYDDWSGYHHSLIICDGGSVASYNNDVVGYSVHIHASARSVCSTYNCRGHVYVNFECHWGAIGLSKGYVPINKYLSSEDKAGHFIDKGVTEHNSSEWPKQEKPTDPPPPPPPPPPSYIWTEGSWNCTDLKTIPEGGGSPSSNRYGQIGQGNWNGAQAHKGYADIPEALKNWCSGGRNFTVWITFHRITSGGNAGATPRPHIRRSNNTYWDSGVGFARGDTKTIQLPSDLASQVVNRNISQIILWTGQNSSMYSHYDSCTIKIKCEKPT